MREKGSKEWWYNIAVHLFILSPLPLSLPSLPLLPLSSGSILALNRSRVRRGYGAALWRLPLLRSSYREWFLLRHVHGRKVCHKCINVIFNACHLMKFGHLNLNFFAALIFVDSQK